MGNLSKVRIDKWLWATRWFKTRTLATDACQSGRVKVEGVNAKPAYNVQVGQTIQLTKNSIRYTLKVEDLLEKRVGAPEAQKCYTDLTPAEEKERFNPSFFLSFEVRDKGAGRPTKKERRDIDKFKEEED
jgi:ribosome-associated heat shock protein Hsp15